ncbi:hypothetical protein [Streptomyces sp. NPDC050528]|uniref:hypothetical protein n=1 Tax=Streptomyces sp. NPDC050528 TaxID=3365623 RepID=UPI003797D68D
MVRASAIRARTQTINQFKSLIVTAPDATREALRSLTTAELICRLAASRPGSGLTTPAAAVKLALKRLAKRSVISTRAKRSRTRTPSCAP